MKNLLFILITFLLNLPLTFTQQISTHQYRRVAPADMQEYIKRETTYWKKFAENEIEKGNLTFWGIFQKMGGTDQENSPNILIINSFKDLDKGADWNSIADLFPNVKMEDIQTWTLSTNTDQIFLRVLDNHIEVDNPEFNYVRIIYHNVKNTGTHLNFEAQKWKPMVEKAMAEGKTTIRGWGNGLIIAPESTAFDYNTYSYDLFSSSHAALSPAFTEDHELPDGFFNELADNYDGPRHANLYRIVAAVSAESD
jgi:hypothetical protein